MTKATFPSAPKTLGTALALSIGLALSGCGGMPSNGSIYSVNQPVVERTNYTLDVSTGSGGLSIPEQRRLAGWFEAMDIRYGDRVSIDDPLGSPSTAAAVGALAKRYGILVSEDAPTTPGYVDAGTARVILTRSTASVPNCPNWSARSDVNLRNATSTNYGCATNSNLAAMVADPEHLIQGAKGDSTTVVMSSSKAIATYRETPPTGKDGISETGSKDN